MQTNAWGHVLMSEFGQGEPMQGSNGYGGVPIPGSSGEILPGERGCLTPKKDGTPCKAPPQEGTDICVGHERMQETQKVGS